ncbi:6-phosphogluconate dehydratase [Marinitoga sp. 1135]|uniref:EDD domain protein, DegV family n=1 Tax=Marinitoga piezophila (strain DSM 14283 / JCM 11233 / KA3) TaxID=443254 RepID=H2J3K1_MARPK|nr:MULTISPECIES: DegV family protein [Marinitoga]AEX84645.1 EDD domain protein, DegV family [Marinitoga piezophila KA3]APT75162.1 6-phosphogluconate dehydratase [Marinitoga sp. 1137]NUU94936.1 6-phosphogluconate dehydratase [Marinitoga sp. 1135]NUU96889.1 6-phosphogluconate dehydratase [Marinitoga sp. 1138]
MKRAIIVDSGCSPTPDWIEKYNLKFMGMKVYIDGKEYTDGVDLSKEKFYDLVEGAEEIHTAQPSLKEIMNIYESLKEEGYDEIVDIHFSSKMSGLYNTANMAKNMLNDINLKIVDTKMVSIGASLVARRIVELLNEGREFEEVNELIPKIIDNTFMEFSVPTLKYLIKNGRIGKAAGMAGTLLKIIPVLTVEDAEITPLAKVRGLNKAYKTMSESLFEFIKNKPYNIKIYKIHGFESNKEQEEKVFNMFMDKFQTLGYDYELIEGRIWPTVACHSGPEVFGLAVYGEEKPL